MALGGARERDRLLCGGRVRYSSGKWSIVVAAEDEEVRKSGTSRWEKGSRDRPASEWFGRERERERSLTC